MESPAAARRIEAACLRRFAEEAFEQVGCSLDDARCAAAPLLWASLRGVDTHGIRNLVPYYLRPIQQGKIAPQPQIVTSTETQVAARLDGGGGMGLVAATGAMRMAMQKALATGVGMVAVENSHHLGPAGFYASMGLESGLIGFCTTGHFFGDGHRIGVAPINALRVMLSTNPLSFAAPCGRHAPFLLDMSTSAITVNRIEALGQAGLRMPAGWAKDASGRETVDPAAASLLYPLGGEPETGGHKGAALSMMTSILTGVLSGGWKEVAAAESVKYAQATMGHFTAAVRIDQFMPLGTFHASMDAFLDAITSSPRVDPNQGVHYPGSQEEAIAERRRREGIPIDDRLAGELCAIGRALSMDVGFLE